MDPSRREFLARLARGAAYAAPVVTTLAMPESLRAQGSSGVSEKGGMGGGMVMGGMASSDPGATFGVESPASAPAPWEINRPGGG